MAIPSKVTVCECWARDGLQSIPDVIPTEHKLEMIGKIVDSGVTKLECTSFSPLPQFADCVDVLRGMERREGVSYVVLMPNAKGFQRYVKEAHEEGLGVDEIILMISSSEMHNKINFRMDHETAKKVHAEIIAQAHEIGVKVIGCPGTVYGCAIQGEVPMDAVRDITGFYLDAGCQTIMLGDTTGAANPNSVRERIGNLIETFPDSKDKYIAHFHDTRGNGIVNSIVALEMGLQYVDTSLGAIGGQPATKAKKYQYGFTGNTCSEDLVALLDEMGIDTGIDVDKYIEAGMRAEEVIGFPLRANVVRCGRVNHEAQDYKPYDN